MCAAAHLLRYGDDSPAGGVGEIDWFVFWPNETATGAALLSAAEEQLDAWECREFRFNGNLPAPLAGVPDPWPHVIELITAAGYAPRDDRDEAIFGGTLDSVSPPGEAPVRDMRINRTAGVIGICFTAWLDDTAVCTCECGTDLDQGGRLPAFSRWAELSELGTEEDWRNKGIGAPGLSGMPSNGSSWQGRRAVCCVSPWIMRRTARGDSIGDSDGPRLSG